MRPIFSDPAPRWVPYGSGTLITVGVTAAMLLQGMPLLDALRIGFGVLLVLLVLIYFQGRYYWRGQVETLSTDGMRYEAVTTRWLGRGKRIPFTPTEASNWVAIAKTDSGAEQREPASLSFTVGGRKLTLSLYSAKLADLDALTSLSPAFFRKFRTDYRGFKGIAG